MTLKAMVGPSPLDRKHSALGTYKKLYLKASERFVFAVSVSK